MSDTIDITVLPVEDTVMEIDELDDIEITLDSVSMTPPSENPDWTDITNKPFTSLDTTTLKVESGVLKVNTTDIAELDNTKPITSSGVQVIVGNIEVLLGLI